MANNRFSLSPVRERYLKAFAEAWPFNASPDAHAALADAARDLAECYDDMAAHSSTGQRYRELAKLSREMAAKHDEAAGRVPMREIDPNAAPGG